MDMHSETGIWAGKQATPLSQGEIDIGLLEDRLVDFLGRYGVPAVVGPQLAAVLGEGDGEERLGRLITACGYEDRIEAFIHEILDALSHASPQAVARVNLGGIDLPQELLLAFLEEMLPGSGFVNIRELEHYEALCNLEVPEGERDSLRRVLHEYPVRLSHHTLRQIRLSENIGYQYLPFADELSPEGQVNTWIGQFHQGVVEQMYDNRVILVLHMSCPVYCRFCFRKHKETREQAPPTVSDVDAALDYVAGNDHIREVVLTGGEPLMNRKTVEQSIYGLARIPHIETVRLAARTISYHPQMLRRRGEFWMKFLIKAREDLAVVGKHLEVAGHFIHPDETSIASLEIIAELARNGIPIYIQTPFLAGCNDDGEVLVRLYHELRLRGAEMHYIFFPCSAIKGNRRYWSPIATTLRAGNFLRAQLSDRAIPHLTTATKIGKIDWLTSGWAVERDTDDPEFLWIRTPYTAQYFSQFVAAAEEIEGVRENEDGMLEARFMADIGDDALFVSPRVELPGVDEVDDEEDLPYDEEQIAELYNYLPDIGPEVVSSGCEKLCRVHLTRVELRADCDDPQLRQIVDYVASQPEITDVVLRTETDLPDSQDEIERVVRALRADTDVRSFRMRSRVFHDEPLLYDASVVERYAALQSLEVADPVRFELETLVLSADQLDDAHRRVVEAFHQRGVTVYLNSCLLHNVNDTAAAMRALSSKCRRFGFEFHHLYVAGAQTQRHWNSGRPVDLDTIIGIATELRRNGSGRELPRLIISTELGEVDFGPGCHIRRGPERGTAEITLWPYTLDYFRAMDPAFSWPDGVREDQGHPVVTMPGLRCGYSWGPSRCP
jgi:lysine 2,3-aminomutase